MFFLDSSLLSLTEYPALNENLNLGKTENKNFLERSENKDNRYLSMEENNIFDDFECDVDDSDKDKDYVPEENSTDSEDLNLKVLKKKKLKCFSKNLNSLAHNWPKWQ